MEEEKPVKKRSLSSYLSNVSSRREELERIAKKKAEDEARRKREAEEQARREQEERERLEKERVLKEEQEKMRIEEEKKKKAEELARLKRNYEEQLKRLEEERSKREQEEAKAKREQEEAKAKREEELLKTKREEELQKVKREEEIKSAKREEEIHKIKHDEDINAAKLEEQSVKQRDGVSNVNREVQEAIEPQTVNEKSTVDIEPASVKAESSNDDFKKDDVPTNENEKLNKPPNLTHPDISTDSSQFSNEPLSRHLLKSILREKKAPTFEDGAKDDDEELSDTPTEPASPPRAKRGRLVRGDQIEKTLIRNDHLNAASDSELSDIEDIKSTVISSSVFQEGGLSPIRNNSVTKHSMPSSPVRRNSDDIINNDGAEKRTREKKSHIAVPKVPKQKKSIYRDSGGRTRLQIACDKGKYDVAKKMIEEEDYDVNDQDNAGNSPLHEAALNGYLSIVKLLVSHGANVNIQSYEMFKDTPLVDASANGHLDVVKYLLKHGADPTITNAKGLTAYESIEEDSDLDENEIKVVEEIKRSLTEATRRWKSKHGIQDSANTSDTSRPSSPVIKHAEEPVTSFSDEFYWTDISSSGGKKKLFRASKEGYLPYVGSYLENGGRPDFNAFLEAVKYGHEDIASIFLAFGAKINKQNKEGLTPLMIAVGRNHLGTVRLLLEAGAHPLKKDNKGRTAFYYAKHNIFESVDDNEIKLLNDAVTKWNEKYGTSGTSINEDTVSMKKHKNKEAKRPRDELSDEDTEEVEKERKRHQSISKRSSSVSRSGSHQELSKLQRSESPHVSPSPILNKDEKHSNEPEKNYKLKQKSSSHTDIVKSYNTEIDHATKNDELESIHKRPRLQSHVSESSLIKEEEAVKQETPEEREVRLKAEEEYIQKRLQQKKKKELELLQKMEIDQQKREQEREKQRIEEEKRQEELRKQKEIELEKMKEAQELERRKSIRSLYPLGLKLISFAKKDDYARFLPLYYYTDKSTGSKYVLDIQMTVILKDDSLNNRGHPDSHEVKHHELRKLWNLLKFIYLYGGNYVSDNKPQYVVNFNGVDMETRLGFETLEFTKFSSLPMHWVNFDLLEIDPAIKPTIVENMVEIDVSLNQEPPSSTPIRSRTKPLQERHVPLKFRRQYVTKITQQPLW
ncbi:Protein HOS4 [Nakaseomyces bracarensis]|uniref:Protein HOS4 n=1 Tax=Nakaseomyces bracarensis TaxID=273131 RepID=A0ABR4NMV0_9SACH